mgnify:CR=1 FL=1
MIPSDLYIFGDISIIKGLLAVLLTSFSLYVLIGGTQRIVKVIEKVVAQQPWGPVQIKAKDTVVQILSQIAETNILKPYERILGIYI